VTIKSDIAECAETFREMSYAKLLAHGRRHHASRAGFAAYKKALLEIGIDFDAMASRIEKQGNDSTSFTD